MGCAVIWSAVAELSQCESVFAFKRACSSASVFHLPPGKFSRVPSNNTLCFSSPCAVRLRFVFVSTMKTPVGPTSTWSMLYLANGTS